MLMKFTVPTHKAGGKYLGGKSPPGVSFYLITSGREGINTPNIPQIPHSLTGLILPYLFYQEIFLQY